MAATKILMIECMEADDEDESAFLERLLNMLDRGSCDVTRIKVSTKRGFLTKLKGLASKRWDHVHISAHGEEHAFICVGDDVVAPDELPEGCFHNAVVTISACGLGRMDFFREFAGQTGAKVVIAPLNDVEMTHAAIFYCLFYYLVVVAGMTPSGAFDRAKDALAGRALGGFGYFR
jgi:hypothetical protein